MALGKNYVVSISDEENNTFTVSLKFDNRTHSEGTWKTLSMGAIRAKTGILALKKSLGTLTTYHLHFVVGDYWGIRLNDFEDILSVNDEGMGYLAQPWVISLKPGRISWSLLSWSV